MTRLEKAREFRKLINANLQATRKLIRVDELDENELLDMIDLYESYQVGKSYKVDDIFKYEGKLYKVIQEHTSQGGTWKEAKAVYVLDGGTWKEAKAIYARDSGTWKESK